MRYPLDAEDLQEFTNLLNLLNNFTDVLDGELVITGWDNGNPAKIIKENGQWVMVINFYEEEPKPVEEMTGDGLVFRRIEYDKPSKWYEDFDHQ
jgi:hypothetical protein